MPRYTITINIYEVTDNGDLAQDATYSMPTSFVTTDLDQLATVMEYLAEEDAPMRFNATLFQEQE